MNEAQRDAPVSRAIMSSSLLSASRLRPKNHAAQQRFQLITDV
jgi:hypothetical protein